MRFRMRVVLPEPRKPVMMVMGMGAIFCTRGRRAVWKGERVNNAGIRNAVCEKRTDASKGQRMGGGVWW